jgi:hypothetical protein
MSGLTRRAALGKGVVLAAAAAAGGGGTVVALGGTKHRRLDLHVERLQMHADLPSFGSMVGPQPVGGPLRGALAGGLGTYSTASLGESSTAHTLELAEGTIVAVGPLGAATATIAGGTGSYARASGTITIMRSLGAGGAPRADLAVELEL